MSDTQLVRIRTEEDRIAVVDRARAMLERARTPVEAKQVADLAKAAERYARLQKLGEEAVSHARAIAVEALALMGEMLKVIEKNKGGGDGSNQHKQATSSRREEVAEKPPSLLKQGISHKQSMHAQSLAIVRASNPDLYEEVRAGKKSIATAHVEVKRQEKREELAALADAESDPKLPPWEIHTGDCLKLFRADAWKLDGKRPRLIFADPPYNIGVDYGMGADADRIDPVKFVKWCGEWIAYSEAALTKDGSFWLLISDEFALELGTLVKHAFHLQNWIIWYESFGVNCARKFNRTKRHLFHATKSKDFVFNEDAVTRESDRQTKYNDARANPGGKLLDDVWFDIPRLAGTATERLPDFPTQLPLALLGRIVRCASMPADLVLDPFCGSGTTGAASLAAGRSFVGFEKCDEFARLARARMKGVKVDMSIPIAAAPADFLKWYSLCYGCGAKFFAPTKYKTCPRCSSTELKHERRTPPWSSQ